MSSSQGTQKSLLHNGEKKPSYGREKPEFAKFPRGLKKLISLKGGLWLLSRGKIEAPTGRTGKKLKKK